MEWVLYRKRFIPAINPIVDYWTWHVSNILKINRKIGGLNIWEKGDYTVFWEKESHDQVAKFAFNELLNNSPEKIRKKGIKSGEEVVKFCKDFCKNLDQKKLSDFKLFFQGMKEKYNEFIIKSVVYWLFTGNLMEEKINKSLQDYTEKEKQEILKIMTIPQIPSYSNIEEKEFEKLVELAKEKGIKNIQKEIKKFSEKYFWFQYEYVGPDIWDTDSVKKRIKEELENPSKKTEEMDIQEKQKECIKKYSLSKGIIKLFKILHILILMQDDRKMYNSHACYYINDLVAKKLAELLDTTIEDIRYLNQALFEKYLEDQNLEGLHKELEARKKFLVNVQTDDENSFYTGKEAKNKLKELGISIKEEIANEVKGKVANQGKVKGRARVLLTSSGVTDFKQGDILITGMTTPDFVPLIGKAAAIVTDEGGILCHAAIVSRELDIPCIVGTNNATKTIKDGDIIEVDAKKGIVKKIK